VRVTRGVPEVVREANLQAAQIQFDYGQFAEAAAKYSAFVQGSPNQQSEVAQAARLRQGIAHARAKQLPEAMRALRPLAESATLGDQATWWIGRVQRGSVEGTNPAALMQQTQNAITTFGRAAEKAAALGKTDPAAAARRMDILLDVADSYAAIRQYNEAAPIFDHIFVAYPGNELATYSANLEMDCLAILKRYGELRALVERVKKSPIMSDATTQKQVRDNEAALKKLGK